MSMGTYFSGTAHAGLLVWMVAGWGMQVEPLPFEIANVSMVSGADFAAMTQGVQPDQPSGQPAEIEQPVLDAAPAAPNVEIPPEVPAPPAPVAPPTPEAPPVAPELTVPDTVVTDVAPTAPDAPTILTPPPSAELGASDRPVPRAAPRVAPETITPPEADVTVAPDVAQAATDQTDALVEENVEIADETTAPEAASDQIVTEAEVPAFAPEISRVPQTRPNRPTPAPDEVEAPAVAQATAPVVEAPTDEVVDPVAAALAEAGAADTPAPGLSGGQLSEGDKSGFLRQIGACWNTGTLSTGAQSTIIEMAFDMTPDGRPVSTSVRMEGFSGGSGADAEAAFQTARRALLRCAGDGGYDLPAEQFAQWQRVILTVDPTAMRQR